MSEHKNTATVFVVSPLQNTLPVEVGQKWMLPNGIYELVGVHDGWAWLWSGEARISYRIDQLLDQDCLPGNRSTLIRHADGTSAVHEEDL